MLDELAGKDQDINEETLLQYGAFIVQQVGPITTNYLNTKLEGNEKKTLTYYNGPNNF